MGWGFNPSGKIPHVVEQLSPGATSTEPALNGRWAATTEAHTPRTCAPQEKKLPQWEAFAPQPESSPHS